MKKYLILLSLSLVLFTSFLSGQTVYITNTGEKYHSSGCKYLRKSKVPIELSDALAQGYAACKVCRPVQVTKSSKEETNKPEGQGVKQATEGASSQCTATTKSGTRCKRMTKSSNGKCWQHGGG